jgi:quercetin dioxygenase-like cupin family protein
MTLKLRKPLLSFVLVCASCAPTNRFYLHYDGRLAESDLQQVLNQNPLGPQANIKVVTLGKGETVSHHIVQIRDRETPHVHRSHDLTVFVVRGEGPMFIDKQERYLRAGDAVFIPRGTVHHFTNTSPRPAVALVVFSPPFDGKDTIPVNLP